MNKNTEDYNPRPSRNERNNFGHVEVERIESTKRSRAMDDGVYYDDTPEKDCIPDVQENISRLLKVVTQAQEAFNDLSRRLEPALTPVLKKCESEEKESPVKYNEISPLGNELRGITNMVRNLQFDIAGISDRIQL